MIRAIRSVAATARPGRAALATWSLWLLVGILGCLAKGPSVAPFAVGGHVLAGVTSAVSAVSGAAFTARADDHEECALVEALPEASDDDAAQPARWPAFVAGGRACATAGAANGPWRCAASRRKRARGPPAAVV
jgi:hypothetical protein